MDAVKIDRSIISKDGKMTSFFNYNTLRVQLDSSTKSVDLKFLRPSFNLETLFELETFFNWLATHVEINSVVISNTNKYFSTGFDSEEMQHFTPEKLHETLLRFQKLSLSMFFLPQTIIMDLKGGALGLAAEFTLGADLRLANQSADITFNHLHQGLISSSGGIGLLAALVGNNLARNWNLSSTPIPIETLENSGFLFQTYRENNFDTSSLCESIALQSPISRIQTKRALLDSLLPEFERIERNEKEFTLAGITVLDWKTYLDSLKRDERPTFFSPLELAREISEKRKQQTSTT
jgi:enoyl-CoA hydratase/carnithine racemase